MTEYYQIPNSKKEYDEINWPVEPMAISHLLRINLKAIFGMGWTSENGKITKIIIDFNPKAP